MKKILIFEDDQYQAAAIRKALKDSVSSKIEVEFFEQIDTKKTYDFSADVISVDLEMPFKDKTAPEAKKYGTWGGMWILDQIASCFRCIPAHPMSQKVYVSSSFLEVVQLEREFKQTLDYLEANGIFIKWSKSNEAVENLRRFIQTPEEAADKDSVVLTAREVAEIEMAALHDDPVLIIGPSGSGKESIARQIHRTWIRNKSRKDAPFAAINCAQFEGLLARSEVFGHVKGSYTSAETHHLGKWLLAAGLVDPGEYMQDQDAGSTDFKRWLRSRNRDKISKEKNFDLYLNTEGAFGILFLDEIGELDKETQPTLLRALQNGEVAPIGYAGTISEAKVRVISATSRPEWMKLALRVGEPGPEVRMDLFFRLAHHVIIVEPLKDVDVPVLVKHFRDVQVRDEPEMKDVEWSPKAITRLQDEVRRGKVRGDVRELQIIVRQANRLAKHGWRVGLPFKDVVTEKVVERIISPPEVSARILATLEVKEEPETGGSTKVIPQNPGEPSFDPSTLINELLADHQSAMEEFIKRHGEDFKKDFGKYKEIPKAVEEMLNQKNGEKWIETHQEEFEQVCRERAIEIMEKILYDDKSQWKDMAKEYLDKYLLLRIKKVGGKLPKVDLTEQNRAILSYQLKTRIEGTEGKCSTERLSMILGSASSQLTRQYLRDYREIVSSIPSAN